MPAHLPYTFTFAFCFQTVSWKFSVLNISPLITIGNIISVGDLLYYSVPPYTTPLLAGKITAINVDIPAGTNEIVFDTSFDPSTTPITIQDPFFFYIKNSIAESHGVLGNYCEVTLENDDTEAIEMFMLESELMKSFP